jgi:hypothetical protein
LSKSLRVYLRIQSGFSAWKSLASILETIFPVKFESSPFENEGGVGVLLDNLEESGKSVTGLPTLRVPGAVTVSEGLRPIEVTFADQPEVPFPFRGRSLRIRAPLGENVLTLRSGEKCLAAYPGGPVWTVSLVGGIKHFRSALPLPSIPAHGALTDVLNGERFLEMLPLLDWLRQVCAEALFQSPPLRACLMFDDPNLHWPTYGFVNFREIATRAARNNYHVSFATIPLDTWFTHQGAAECFRESPEQLSLCVHGNDHTKLELALPYEVAEKKRLLRQALVRVQKLEQKTGLRVSRVMVPPYGAVSEDILAFLPECGFNAACVSHGSLQDFNRRREWTRKLGYLPAELVQGCLVLPRWALAGNAANTALLAAYLGQAIILRGHHQDLRDGVEMLDGIARTINSLGEVRWASIAELSRLSCRWRMEGNRCRIEPLAREVYFQPPAPATEVVLENSRDEGGSWYVSFGAGARLEVKTGEVVPLSGDFRSTLTLQAKNNSAVGTIGTRNKVAPTAYFRRILTECRDRLWPLWAKRSPVCTQLMSQFGTAGNTKGPSCGAQEIS